MNETAYYTWNPSHQCFDQASDPARFAGDHQAMVMGHRGVETVTFRYDGPIIEAPISADDETLADLYAEALDREAVA